MPNDPALNHLPAEALDAFLEGVLKDLKNPSDPETLDQVRSIFRKRIPLQLRSYAAALLILRAAGLSRPGAPVTAQGPAATAAPAAPSRVPGRATRESRQKAVSTASAISDKQTSPYGPVAPLFVSMGKRQHLRPAELRALISEKTGTAPEALGRVRLFDNYCFIDVPEVDVSRIVSAMGGSEIHGRPVEIKPARKRGEEMPESK